MVGLEQVWCERISWVQSSGLTDDSGDGRESATEQAFIVQGRQTVDCQTVDTAIKPGRALVRRRSAVV
jgi:hypothetical protein